MGAGKFINSMFNAPERSRITTTPINSQPRALITGRFEVSTDDASMKDQLPSNRDERALSRARRWEAPQVSRGLDKFRKWGGGGMIKGGV